MTQAHSTDWAATWNERAAQPSDFAATGRGGMDVVGFLHTVREIARSLCTSRGDRLLDIGCGTGILALALSGSVAAVHGIDLSPAMIARARINAEGCDNVSFSVASISAPGIERGRYNKVLAYSVLQYLAGEVEVAAALQTLQEILPAGGIALYGANPDPDRLHLYVEQIRSSGRSEADQRRSLDVLERILAVRPQDLEEMARAAGLRPKIRAISPRIWQHFYMFDLILHKDG